MFTINYDSLTAEAQSTQMIEDAADSAVIRSQHLYLHENAVLQRTSSLVGKQARSIFRVKHPSLKYVRLPLDFLQINEDSNCNASDKYIVTEKFRQLDAADMPNVCIYFGIMAEAQGEKKCKNHAHCLDFQSYLLTEGVEKFIKECNTLETILTFDIIQSYFNSSNDVRVSQNNKKLAAKVKNCFWFDCARESTQVKVVGNINVPKGESSFPLISTIVANNSYDIKMSTIDLGNYPQITASRIFNSRVYIHALEGVQLSFDTPLGSLSSISLDFKPIPQHKLVSFEIFDFKNSNWPMRALTDALITLFARGICSPIVMHWSYATEVLIIGLLSQLVFIILSLTEISKSERIDGTEKFMWFIGFIFMGTISGLLYILSARKRIITN